MDLIRKWRLPNDPLYNIVASILHLQILINEAYSCRVHLCTSTYGSISNGGSIQVTEASRRRADTNCLIRRLNVQRVLISITVNSNSSNSEPLRGPHDSASYFPSIGYQDFLYPLLSGFLLCWGRQLGKSSYVDTEGCVTELPTENDERSHGRHVKSPELQECQPESMKIGREGVY